MDPLNLFLEFTNICRLCLSQDRHLVKIFPDTGQEQHYSIASKIIACVGIQVQDDDNLPDKICERCIKEIENWSQFKQICDNANTLLLQSVSGFSPLQNQILQNNLNSCHEGNLDILGVSSVFDERLALEAESFFQKIDEKHLPSLLSADSLSSAFIDGNNVDQNETITLYRGGEDDSAGQTRTPDIKAVKKVVNVPETSVGMNLDLTKGLIVKEPEVGLEDIMVVTKLEEPKVRMEDAIVLTEPEVLNRDTNNSEQPKDVGIKEHVLQESDMNIETSNEWVKDQSANYANRQGPLEQNQLRESSEFNVRSKDILREDYSFEDENITNQLIKDTKENRKEEIIDPAISLQRKKWVDKYYRIYKKKYDCGFCPRLFSKFSHLLNHDKIDHRAAIDKEKCEKCGYCFISKGRLVIHTMLRHKEKEFFCSHCSFNSVSKQSLRMHIQYTHIKQIVLHPCPICGRHFRSKSNLTNHVKLHGSPTFTCEICGNAFRQKQTLTRHYNTFHSEHRSFECDLCLKQFKSFENLQIHKQTHNPAREAVCDKCGVTYKNKRTLSIHKKTHEEKKFICDVCSKSFTTKNLLNRHMNIHTNLRKYVCEVCDKWFNRPDLLKSHLLIHCNVQKPFKCGTCDLTFRFKRYLKIHTKKMH